MVISDQRQYIRVFFGWAFFGNMSIACYCHLKWPSFFGKDGHEGKKHPESMHTHHAQAPPSAKVPRIGGEYHFPMVADVSSHYFITYSKTPRICRMTTCCEQNCISESWKKMLKLHFPVLLAGGIIPIIRSHKWPSYHKKSHGSGYEFSQQPSKGCGWSLPTINSEGAWDIYNKPPKKNILDHLVSQSYSSHLNSKQPRVPREKKNHPFCNHRWLASRNSPHPIPFPGPHLLQRRVFFRWPTWESSKVVLFVQSFRVGLAGFLFESFAKH